MNFHEYQAKQLFADYGIAVPKGIVARTRDDAVAAAKQIPGDLWVVKAQTHAGGRGKGTTVPVAGCRRGHGSASSSVAKRSPISRAATGDTSAMR